MEKEAEDIHKNPLESEKIGIKPAYEWVEEQLEKLREKYGLKKFKAAPRDFELIRYGEGERSESLLGQEELGEEAIGFVAEYIDGELRMLSVFIDLKDRRARIQKIGYKKETFLELKK